MPTARELLEQADALMRRNRAALADDIPVLTESVPALPEAQVLRGRGAQARAGVPIPPPLPEEGDTIPTLTERVESATTPPDAVAAAEEGEPSDWLQREAGEPSVTGEIPDSVLIVPPAEAPTLGGEDLVFDDSRAPDAALQSSRDAPPPELAAEEIELLPPLDPEAAEDAFDEEFASVPSAAVPVAATEVAEPWAETDSTAPAAETEVAEFFESYVQAEVPAADPTSSEVPPAVNEALEEVAAAEPEDATAGIALSEAVVPATEPAPHVEVVEPAWAPAASLPIDIPVAATASVIAASAAIAPAPSPPVAGDPRWEGVAEEIRMQVLQRIDIFTDTGLREQLALRLQPIVDRASADLVATINQHVGELLRAYVAEAIEREIEIWRRTH